LIELACFLTAVGISDDRYARSSFIKPVEIPFQIRVGEVVVEETDRNIYVCVPVSLVAGVLPETR